MQKIKLLPIIALLLLFSWAAQAQNHTNSPYTRYGYGKLADQSFGAQRGMGGIGVGLRNPKMINSLNPASYSGVDSMTFMFDLGVMGQMAWFEEGSSRSRKTNGSVEYLALQFPLSKNLGVGAGFAPISYVGYDYGGITTLSNLEENVKEQSTGSGGLRRSHRGSQSPLAQAVK